MSEATAEPQTTDAGNPSGEAMALLDGSGQPQPILLPRIGGEPPTEHRAFVWGANPTTKGTLYLTPEGARQAMDTWRKRGVALCFDYFHSTYNPAVAPSERKAAGQTIPELRDDGVWYTQIQWTPKAAQAIRDGEWPFISPAVLHDKSGVIFEFKNPGLVTDPGTIAARPTVLDSSEENMSDKKRLFMDAYGSMQQSMRAFQALADTDGAEKDIGNMVAGALAALAEKIAPTMQAGGYLQEADAIGKRNGSASKMLAILESELGETDPEKLEGKLMLKLLVAPANRAQVIEPSDTALLKTMLLDATATRYPVTQRRKLEALSPTALVAYLQGSAEIVPSGTAPKEAPQAPPTVTQLQQDLNKMTPIATPNGSGGKPTTLAACSASERAKVETYVDMERSANEAAQIPFDESLAVQRGLALLSDADSVVGNEIRHLPIAEGGSVATLEG